MNTDDLLHEGTDRLRAGGWEPDEARRDAAHLLAHAMGEPVSWVMGHAKDQIWFARIRYRRLIHRRRAHEPMAYITGVAHFRRRAFHTDKRALIPRQETAEMLDLAARWIQPDIRTLIIDIGTGSGALAISAALEFPAASLMATDISLHAIALAKENADMHGVSSRLRFLLADLLDESVRNALGASDASLIVFLVNLPYLPESDRLALSADVVRYEPANALFSSDDGLAHNRRLIHQIADWHREAGRPFLLIMEHDPPQAEMLRREAAHLFPHNHIGIQRDAFNRERFLMLSSAPPIA